MAYEITFNILRVQRERANLDEITVVVFEIYAVRESTTRACICHPYTSEKILLIGNER